MTTNVNVNQAFAGHASFGKRVRIEVQGNGRFPFDQLRRHRLVPVGDAEAMQETSEENFRDAALNQRRVELEFADEVNYMTVSGCADRFASFGWSITGCDVFEWGHGK